MLTKKHVIRILVFIVVLFIGIQITFYKYKKKQADETPTVVMGIPNDKDRGFQKQMGDAFERHSYIRAGEELLNRGQYDQAIAQFERALLFAKLSGEKGMAYVYLANAYEKKRDYKKALEYVLIDKNNYVNDWAKEPVSQRANYLEYALLGNYQLAVKHAELAFEATKGLPNRPKEGSLEYLGRLNDIKASKEHIERKQ